MYILIATVSFYAGIYIENWVKKNAYRSVGDLLHDLVGLLSSSPPLIAYPVQHGFPATSHDYSGSTYTLPYGNHHQSLPRVQPSAPEPSLMQVNKQGS